MENNQYITVSRHPVRDVILVERCSFRPIQHPVRDATCGLDVASLRDAVVSVGMPFSTNILSLTGQCRQLLYGYCYKLFASHPTTKKYLPDLRRRVRALPLKVNIVLECKDTSDFSINK
jgi:hypothetical protein